MKNVRASRRSVWLILFFGCSVAQGEPLNLEITDQIAVRDVPRIGLNLGDWSAWGASQLMGNVLKNPGFEGLIDRALVIVADADAKGFLDDTTWTGRSDGFWSGARFDVLSGSSQGATGLLLDSRKKGRNGLPEFQTLGETPPLARGDVVVITRIDDAGPPAGWWLPADTRPAQVRTEIHSQRPGSQGIRSLSLESTPSSKGRVLSYLDAIGERAGKLLPLEGRWQLSAWIRAASSDASVRFTLQRQGSAPVFQEAFRAAGKWRRIARTFDAQDSGPGGTIQFEILVDAGRVLLDDVSLKSLRTDPSGFRTEAVATLKILRPGYLRDWQGQLGDTWDNRIAAPFGRRASRYRPGADEHRFFYGLSEFLDLCKRIGSRPWVILPPTLVGNEYQEFGRYVAERSRADGFAEIVVEFGNENWNRIFRPAGIPDPRIHGRVAQEAFRRVREGAGNEAPLSFAINGQHVNPNSALSVLDLSPTADVLAVAPYLLNQLDQPENAELVWPKLFERDPFLAQLDAGTRERKRELAIYEVNLHTTRGNASESLREQVVAGSASGSALAQRLMQAVNQGVRRQCVYTFAQYDAWLEDRSGLVKLWGIVRDLGPTQRLRPTGLALSLLNRVLPGDVHRTRIVGPGSDSISALAVLRKEGLGLALVSSSDRPQSLSITLPHQIAPPHRIVWLSATSPGATNETAEEVRLQETALSGTSPIEVMIPPWGMAVLIP